MRPFLSDFLTQFLRKNFLLCIDESSLKKSDRQVNERLPKKGIKKENENFRWTVVYLLIHSSLVVAHYSKSQIFVQKFNFYKSPNIFTSFSPNFFWQFFSWNQRCQQLKKPKTTTFSRVFHPKKFDNFLGKSKLNFWTKNEDFEQCE